MPINHTVRCDVCKSVMESLQAWPIYPDNHIRQYQATYTCYNCIALRAPPSNKTLTVGYLYRGSDTPPVKNSLVS